MKGKIYHYIDIFSSYCVYVASFNYTYYFVFSFSIVILTDFVYSVVCDELIYCI